MRKSTSSPLALCEKLKKSTNPNFLFEAGQQFGTTFEVFPQPNRRLLIVCDCEQHPAPKGTSRLLRLDANRLPRGQGDLENTDIAFSSLIRNRRTNVRQENQLGYSYEH